VGVAFGNRDFQTLRSQSSFFHGDFSSNIFFEQPTNLEEIKHTTDETIVKVDREKLRKAERNTLKWVGACLREDSGYFQHLL
jgi:hypothetical protein